MTREGESATKILVYVNGVPARDVIAVEADIAKITRFKRDADGNYITVADGSEPAVEEVIGKVLVCRDPDA